MKNLGFSSREKTKELFLYCFCLSSISILFPLKQMHTETTNTDGDWINYLYPNIKMQTCIEVCLVKAHPLNALTSFTSNRVKLRLWFTWRSPDIHLMFTWPPDHQLTFPWPSPDPYLTLVRRFELHLKFTWHSPGFPLHSPDFQVTTWLSSDLPLTLTRPLPNID